jgi:hypothetical protein
MGKRELLLVLAFVIAGALVYQVTAPPARADQPGFSVGGLIEQFRRHVRGNRSNAETTSTTAYPLTSATNEVRVAINSESLTVVGEDRADVSTELHVTSNGYDEAEAQRLAGEVALKTVEGGGRLEFKIFYPEGGRQRANVTIHVPAKLRVSIGRYSGKLSVTGTGEVELTESRGETTIRDVPGRVALTHRGGNLTISDVGTLKANTRGADVKVARVRGDTTIQSQAGELNVSELWGPLDIESSGTDLRIDRLEGTNSSIRINANNGSVRLSGVRSETRVDARNSEVVLAMAKPAKVSVFAEGGESVELTPPPGGFDLDATITGSGRIVVPDKMIEVKTRDKEQHAGGSIQGGGPLVTLRAADGEIVIRTPESARSMPPPEKPDRH